MLEKNHSFFFILLFIFFSLCLSFSQFNRTKVSISSLECALQKLVILYFSVMFYSLGIYPLGWKNWIVLVNCLFDEFFSFNETQKCDKDAQQKSRRGEYSSNVGKSVRKESIYRVILFIILWFHNNTHTVVCMRQKAQVTSV